MTVMLKTETLMEREQIHHLANPREIVDYNFDLAASSLGLSESQRRLLKEPFRVVTVKIPVHMDSRDIECTTMAPVGPSRAGSATART